METENQTRLRRAKESIVFFQANEVEARKALANAVEATKRAKEKYEELFIAEENIERIRRMNKYNHCTS